MSSEVEVGVIPDCDVCKTEGATMPAKYDGKTVHGPWAYMCEHHFLHLGIGLGTGMGQRLILRGSE